jgi:hypothetical protein
MKNHCENPDHYDRMVKLLVEHNSLYRRTASLTRTAESNAATIIDLCISKALFDGDYAIGCCFALKTSAGKVRLFLEPLV